MQEQLRRLPAVDRLLGHPRLQEMAQRYPHSLMVEVARSILDLARQAILRGEAAAGTEELASQVAARLETIGRLRPQPVINATGVIIHTNLGRAPLSAEAIAATEAVARGYSDLEFDVEVGERGSRHAHLEDLLVQLTGAEAGLAVNNNAAAVLLGLSALAQGKEVIVSRGQAVEIGGGFRIPEVLRQSGAKLVEVGTTNRTYLRDYEEAIAPETAALLRVHTSNFRVIGFTHQASLEEMVELARRRNLLLLDDLGSGCLIDTTQFGLGKEPLVQDSVAAGADLVFFSGDKLLGGPQAGVVVGRKTAVERLRRHPLARAVRIDKLSLASLAATLQHYLKEEALQKVPVWRMIVMSLEEVERRALSWAQALGERATVVEGRSMIGGGSLPEESLPTKLLALFSGALSTEEVAARLRRHQPPVIARIERDQVLLDPRTVLPEEDHQVVQALNEVLAEAEPSARKGGDR